MALCHHFHYNFFSIPVLSSQCKHLLHCCMLLTVIFLTEVCTGAIQLSSENIELIDPWEQYGVTGTICLYFLRFLTFLALPQILFNFFGLILFNAFPDKVQLKGSPLLAPFICIRVVTRGDYVELVKSNVARNMNVCLDIGVENFMIEVVTDKPLNLPKHRRIREVVVPSTYTTKTGALFKARALQYCLEDDVNILQDLDWIVHLDEETLLTDNSVRGIMNFVLDGKNQFGQGLITYGNDLVVNWITTLADSFRVADDMGKLRCQFNMFHRPLFSWKGSFVVTQLGAERKVSFDNGLDGSVAEDCFFAMQAYREGYSFAFIEGEMYEKSPFTFIDFVQQRKRWLQGIHLVVHSKSIAVKYKILLAISLYAWFTLPLSTSNVFLAPLFPLPPVPLFDIPCAFICGVTIYMYMFGVLKTFSPIRLGMPRFILCILGSLAIVPFNMVIENIAVVWGLLGHKHKFYVVRKELKEPTTV